MLRAIATAVGGTSVALLALSWWETGHPFAAFNAASQIVHGAEAAAREDGASLRYTAVGWAGMSSAIAGWATIATLLAGRRPSRGRAVAAGLGAAAIAYAFDYHVAPPRLRPGIELRLSRGAVVATFGALAASLVVGQRRRGP